jgi:hypothetical protein
MSGTLYLLQTASAIPQSDETNIFLQNREQDFLYNYKMDESETENFWKSKVEQDRDETECIMSLVSRLRREPGETLTSFQDFQYFVTRPGPRVLEI